MIFFSLDFFLLILHLKQIYFSIIMQYKNLSPNNKVIFKLEFTYFAINVIHLKVRLMN